MFAVSVENSYNGYQLFGPFTDEEARKFAESAKKDDSSNKVFRHDLMRPDQADFTHRRAEG